MKRTTICGNMKALAIRALSEGMPMTVADIYDHITDRRTASQAGVYVAVGTLVEYGLITEIPEESPESPASSYTLTRHGSVVADALEVLEYIRELHEHGGESLHSARMIKRAEHRAQKLVERLALERLA
jgi:Fe2+ or Zn2+ uptake regulation protein